MISASPDERRREARHAEVAKRYTAKKRERHVSLTAIRIAELRRLFRARHGLILPDHEAGRDAALIMAHHVARRPDNPRRRITNWLELQAPWMSAAEASAMAAAVLEKPLRWRADKLAARLHVTEAERSRLRITTIGAINMTKAERTKRRKERHRARQRARRRGQGAKSRGEYEAKSLTQTKPWTTMGMSRARWYRAGRPTRETSPCAA